MSYEILTMICILWAGVGQFVLIGILAEKGTTTDFEFIKYLSFCTGPIGLCLLSTAWCLFLPFVLFRKWRRNL